MCTTDLDEILRQVIKKILDLQDRKWKYDLHEIWNAILSFPLFQKNMLIQSLQ